MMHVQRFAPVTGLVVLALSAVASAQPAINYPTFLFNSPFQSNGSGLGVMGNSLLITNNSNETGSIIIKAPQDVTQSFTAQYSFFLGGSGNAGLGLVIEGDPRGTTALGGAVQQIGYGDGQALNSQAIQDSLALIYSTYTDQFQLFANTTNANLNVQTAALATQTGSENLYNGPLTDITLTYTAPDITYPDGAVTAMLNGSSMGLDNISLPASLTSLVGAGTGYFGFTGTTDSTGPSNVAVESLFAGAVPEPGSLVVIAGVGGILALSRRRRRACKISI